MKKIYQRLAALSALLLLAACAASPAPLNEQTLMHHRFVLQSVDGKAYNLKEAAPTISFNQDMRVSGAICNQYSGLGKLEGQRLTVSRLVSTKKLCFEQELNQYEYLISKMLMDGVDLEYEGQSLTMRGGGHTLVYKLNDLVD